MPSTIVHCNPKNVCSSRYPGKYFPISFILVFLISTVVAKPKFGAVSIDGEFGAGIVWDGYALQEKQLSEEFDFGIFIDSEGVYIDSSGLEYYHWLFTPATDITVYIHPWIALGAGYQYGWIDQHLNTPHRLKNNPGGRRLCSSHTIRLLALCSIPLNEKDAIDIISIPFYTFGSVTRIPLPLKIYEGLFDPQSLAMLEEIHEPVNFSGYGFELRVRGRHFLNRFLFAHGSVQIQVQNTHTEDDPLVDFVKETPQGSFGLTLGLGIMFGNEITKKEEEKGTSKSILKLGLSR